jgi:hypothetical protein
MDNLSELGDDDRVDALRTYTQNNVSVNVSGFSRTTAGNKVWVLDSNKKVYVYDQDGKLLSSWTASGLTTPEDITTNGTDIWIADDGSNKVFRFAGAAKAANGSILSAASSFALNSANANAKGIVTNGTHLWVVDDHATSADKVFKYTTAGALVGSWTIDSRNSNPTGITIDPSNVNHIWIVDNADDAVYRYHAAAGNSSGSQSAASLFQLASGNVDAPGIADPPPFALEVGLPVQNSAERDLFALPNQVSSGTNDRALSNSSFTTWSDSWPLRSHMSRFGLRANGSVGAAALAASNFTAGDARAKAKAPTWLARDTYPVQKHASAAMPYLAMPS